MSINTTLESPEFKPFERGIIITGKPSFDTLQVEFSKHRTVAKRLPFILGDLLAYGELAYDAVDQMLEGDDYCDCPILNRGTAYNYKSVSLAWWPPERKVYDKPWSWYQATMSLPAELQDEIMQDAIRFDWNRDRLRAEVGKLQDEYSIKRHREQATYPSDREFDLMVENNELKEQISRMRETQPFSFPDNHTPFIEAVPKASELAKPLIDWLNNGTVGFNSVVIYRNGKVVIKP